ncbi:unnamed protein product, partial [Iphiclides podalirius]
MGRPVRPRARGFDSGVGGCTTRESSPNTAFRPPRARVFDSGARAVAQRGSGRGNQSASAGGTMPLERADRPIRTIRARCAANRTAFKFERRVHGRYVDASGGYDSTRRATPRNADMSP